MATKEGLYTNPIFFLVFTLFFIGGFDSSLVAGVSTLRHGDQLNSTDSLVSQGGNFTLGFFTIPQTNYTYLGIWYTNDDQFNRVWVANRNTTLLSNSSVLTIDNATGILQITSGGNTVLNLSDQITRNATATLEDSGNFVLTDHENGDRRLWESFDNPTDTLLPGMKLGFNLATGKNWSLTSWFSASFPASGIFTMNWEPNQESGQLVIYRRGQPYWTSGNLENQTQTFPNMLMLNGPQSQDYCFLNYISNNDEKYFTFSGLNGSFWMLKLESDGEIYEGPNRLLLGPLNFCYGYQSVNEANGCVISELPKCRSSDDTFLQKRASFLPINARSDYDDNSSLSISDCAQRCWNNCDCVGFNVNSNGTGCITWTGKLEYQQDNITVPIYVLVRGNSSKGKCGKNVDMDSHCTGYFSVCAHLGHLWLPKNEKA
ncbi:unnamed protein product [Camellia sinensis]